MIVNDVIIRKHLVTAQMVKNRLDAAANGEPLTADEIVCGVRLDHAEYLDLVERAAAPLIAARASALANQK